MLSPAESIPARPARPTICLYWLLFRKSVATYGERRMTLNQGRQGEKNKWHELHRYVSLDGTFVIKFHLFDLIALIHVFGRIDLHFTFWEFHRLNEIFHEINTSVVLKDELSVTKEV